MIKITALTLKQKAVFWVQIIRDKQHEEHFLHQETVFKHRLHLNQELSEKTFKDILKEDAYIQAYALAIAKLAYKDHTEQSIKEALKPHDVHPSTLARVVAQLKKENYINEQRQLEQRMKEYLDYDLKGPEFIKQKLQKQGYDETAIDQAINQVPEHVWQEKCKTYVHSLVKQRPLESNYSRQQYLKRKAYQQGFPLELARELIERIAIPHDETEVLQEKLKRYQKQYDITNPKERQRLIQKLQREGFHFHEIQKYLK